VIHFADFDGKALAHASPAQSFGTPLEDALRRDFTINSMFYNINDSVIEDYTGKGYSDLLAGLLRTPLEPLTTMLDDPLRALRAVRFASRYAFELAPDLLHCMACEEVQAALISKVSRERVGRELEGMLSSSRPIGALRMLHQLQLLPLVLPLPKFASLEEVQSVAAMGTDAKRQGKASTAQAALARHPYATSEGALPPTVALSESEVFRQGMLVVNALEQVFHALASSADAAFRGGFASAAHTPPAAPASDTQGGATEAAAGAGQPMQRDSCKVAEEPIQQGGHKRLASPTDTAQDLLLTIRVVVPATDGGRKPTPEHCNPYAGSAGVTPEQSQDERDAVRQAQQLQTARDSCALSADVTGDDMMSACLGAALWPVRGHLVLLPAPKKRPPKPVWGVLTIMREGLKSGNKQADSVKAVQECAEQLLPLLGNAAGAPIELADSAQHDAMRLQLGLAIREAGELWLPALHLAVAVKAQEVWAAQSARQAATLPLAAPAQIDAPTVAAAVQAGHDLTSSAMRWGLWGAWRMKPLLSGKDLMKLGAPKGSGIAHYIDEMLHWQLLNPAATEADAVLHAESTIAAGVAQGEASEA
jgi:hypothetical protein